MLGVLYCVSVCSAVATGQEVAIDTDYFKGSLQVCVTDADSNLLSDAMVTLSTSKGVPPEPKPTKDGYAQFQGLSPEVHGTVTITVTRGGLIRRRTLKWMLRDGMEDDGWVSVRLRAPGGQEGPVISERYSVAYCPTITTYYAPTRIVETVYMTYYPPVAVCTCP